MPSVAVVVAVHNEEAVLRRRLDNCLKLSYPCDKLEIIVASDGSTDGTVRIANEFAQQHPNVSVVAQDERMGKTVAQNAAVRQTGNDIVIFSDAGTTFNSDFLERVTIPFADGDVGCVSGALAWKDPGESAVAGGGDVYWRYEYFIWRLESKLGLLAWGSGACLAVRRGLWKPIEAQYGEDCIVPLDVVAIGSRVVFQPDAIAHEVRVTDPGVELRARIRMTLRSFAGTLSRKHLLNPLQRPGIAWSIISHKVLRWLTPYLLLLAVVSNLVIAGRPLYRITLACQAVFYACAVLGYMLDRHHVRLPLVSTIYAFCLMNLGVAVGVAKMALGRRVFAYRSEA